MDRLKRRKNLLDIRGAELFRRGLYSLDELEEEDCCNYKTRLTIKRVKAAAIRNNVFNLEFLNRLLSSV